MIWTADVFTAVAVIVAGLAVWLKIRAQDETRKAIQLGDVEKFFFRVYVHRRFDPKLKITKDKSAYSLRDAATFFEEELRPRGNETKEEARTRVLEEAKKPDSWINIYFEKSSLALQSVGQMASTGALPVNFVLAVNAPNIVRDWNWSEETVQGHRVERPIHFRGTEDGKEIHFTRRHAEWLACLAKLYLVTFWEGQGVESLVNKTDVPELIKDARRLRRVEGKLVPPGVHRDAERLENAAAKRFGGQCKRERRFWTLSWRYVVGRKRGPHEIKSVLHRQRII